MPSDCAAIMRLLSAACFAGAVAAASPAAAQSAAPSAAERECLRINENPGQGSDWNDRERAYKVWVETCRQALAADSGNLRIKRVLARALGSVGERAEELSLLRELGERGDASAWYDIYEIYKSFYRSDVNKPQLVKRAEAEQALRKAAALGHADAIVILAVLLDRGSTVKRNAREAIQWAERAVANPPKDDRMTDMQVLLGRLLVKSDDADERARGIQLLESLAGRRGDAKAYLARAIRTHDPQRARRLLEDAMRGHAGAALPTLADMLIKGEGGPADAKRAVSLLTGRTASDVPGVMGARGRLLLEGILVPRNMTEAVRLLRTWASWDQDGRLLLMGVLAENPDLAIVYPAALLYDATEAAELDEPGAMDALIALKLSPNKQFSDKTGGCALAAQAGRKPQACGS